MVINLPTGEVVGQRIRAARPTASRACGPLNQVGLVITGIEPVNLPTRPNGVGSVKVVFEALIIPVFENNGLLGSSGLGVEVDIRKEFGHRLRLCLDHRPVAGALTWVPDA